MQILIGTLFNRHKQKFGCVIRTVKIKYLLIYETISNYFFPKDTRNMAIITLFYRGLTQIFH